jgi:hypothetical protein
MKPDGSDGKRGETKKRRKQTVPDSNEGEISSAFE